MRAEHLALLPRDGFFCKDARGWYTSASGRGHALEWPFPSTILGALRTAWGRVEEERSAAWFDAAQWRALTQPIALSAVLALRRRRGEGGWSQQHLVWPGPRDAVCFKRQDVDARQPASSYGAIERLEPQPVESNTLGRDDDPAREALWRPLPTRQDKPERLPAWWRHEDFIGWLAGRPVTFDPSRSIHLRRRLQTHVGIRSEEQTADEGVLFAHDVIETLDCDGEWAIAVRATFPNDARPRLATLGSDGRPVWVEPLRAEIFDPPKQLLEAFQAGSAGLRLVVVTPACFQAGWLPDGFTRQGLQYRGALEGVGDVILRAAYVPRPLHISGWDMEKGQPKPTARMVAPGAVYFFERPDNRPFTASDARALWLAAVGASQEQGFGCVVPGVWSPARSHR